MRNRSTIQCSRCKVDAEIVSLGPIDVDHCSLCGNVWFDNRELEKASAAADGAWTFAMRFVAWRPSTPSHRPDLLFLRARSAPTH